MKRKLNTARHIAKTLDQAKNMDDHSVGTIEFVITNDCNCVSVKLTSYCGKVQIRINPLMDGADSHQLNLSAETFREAMDTVDTLAEIFEHTEVDGYYTT